MKQLPVAGLILMATLGAASAQTRNFCNGDVTLGISTTVSQQQDGERIAHYFGIFSAPEGRTVRATVRVTDPRLEWSSEVRAQVTSNPARTRIAYSLFSKTNGRPLTVNDILDSTTIRCG